GQLTRRLNGFSEELFLYDEAANLLGHQRQVAFNNQVTTSEEYDYTYDGFGRMAQRRVRDSAVCQHYHYDAEHRITAVTFEHDPQGNQRAEYDYDILGRRTGKRVWQSAQAQRLKQSPENRAPEETVQFCWNGLRLAAEKSSKSAHLTLHYVYNGGSYNPLARIESFDHPEKQSTDISYYHIALNGLPEELTDSQGRIIWHGDYSLWGKLKREQHPVAGFRGQQNLRFQGQYFDRETGLHYNTFRYYAPDTGRFTQQDPIGLMGGLNLYQYAPNPVGWVDPWGWACGTLNYRHKVKPNKVTNERELRRQIRGQIRAFNKILKAEGMEGLKKRINDYSSDLEKQGREYVRKLGSAGKDYVWLHEPDMRTGGLPSDVKRIGLSRENSIIGGNAPSISRQIMDMSDNVTKLTSKLFMD
ncbi:RHS repeat-associated core domain-containing protein, partial [Morganella morganii]